jgi:hypothetical protein
MHNVVGKDGRKKKEPLGINLHELSNKEIADLEREVEIKEGLPHLFGWNWYKWQHEFFHSTNRDNFICSSNQCGKSTIQISKAIHWATETELWPKLWHSKPSQFWYLYPSLKLATNEFNEKWVKEILPRNGYEKSKKYGWTADIRQKTIHNIKFNSGVTIYFCSYAQDEADLQASTCYAIFGDEELPEDILPELQARIRATRGYFHMVFTATLGQEIWRRTMEEKGQYEKFPSAFKRQVSLYDCQRYMDGKTSQWTDERILEEIRRCGTKQEVDRRIFGKFVVSGGLKYPAFDRSRHVKEKHMLNFNEWRIYSAVDVGSGGEKGHPAAIVFLAVNPTYTSGRVFRCWRGDGVQTTASDILTKYQEMKGKQIVTQQIYDWASKDFQIISARMGEPFMPAEKSHEIGENIVNTLFRNDMLFIYDDEESRKLVNELIGLKNNVAKNLQNDHLVDSLRYVCASIPWDFSCINAKKTEQKVEFKIIDERDLFRLKQLTTKKTSNEIEEEQEYFNRDEINEEFDLWNQQYEE